MYYDHKEIITPEDIKETLTITNVGAFIWNLQTGHVIYSKEWASIVGYELHELAFDVTTWENMLLPEDLKTAEVCVDNYLSGVTDMYTAEFRMIKKDGTIIWGLDKGKITKYDEYGNPLILCGVLQDITTFKNVEFELRENREKLALALDVAEFGGWEWDVLENRVYYNDEFLKMFGYNRDEITGTLEEWISRNHPDDLTRVTKCLDDYVEGKTGKYNVDTRILHKNGEYIWIRDVGKIVSRREDGTALRLVGGHLNINELKLSQLKLEETLNELENHQAHLETEIELRTKSLIDQDFLLTRVNEVSQTLLSVTDNSLFNEYMVNCLEKLAHAFDVCQVDLWKTIKTEHKSFAFLSYTYYDGQKIAFDVEDIEEYILNLPDDEIIHIRKDSNIIINYTLIDSDYIEVIEKEEEVIADFMQRVPIELRDYILNNFKNYRSLLLVPVYISESLYGYIAISHEKENIKYTQAQKNMLIMSGNIFATAHHRYRLDEQLIKAHEEALLSSQAKTNFLANMSHEIRTPLNAILGMSEIILRESIGRATEEYAVEIKNASESLLSIINDILDISKIESGKLEVIELEYYINSLFHDVIGLSKIRIADKPILFTTYIDNNIPAKLKGDEIRIKQILLNLLSNAIKFTKSGNIHFEATCENNNGISTITFKVHDTGMGIKEEDIDRLFMQFERVDTKKNRNIEGTGLGLAITKQLCEMMGGNIYVESNVGIGSTFTVVIPQKYKNYMPLVETAQSKKILVYEAREYHAKSTSKSIKAIGSSCTVCTNQSDLLNFLNEGDYDYLFAPTVHLSKIKALKQSLNRKFNIVLMIDPGDTIIYRDILTINLPINCLQLSNIFGNGNALIQDKEKIEHFIAPDANILVVDDNLVNLKVAKGLMSPYKFHIETAINGAIAVEMVKNNIYDLIFMDHMMPEMDGIDATNAIRALNGDYFKNVPIIALTANALVGAKELFVKEGMDDFLAKPIEMKKLNSILLKWIPDEKIEIIEPVSKKKEESSDAPLITIGNINTDYGIKLIGGNLEDYIDVLHSFYSDGLNKINSISKAFGDKNIKAYRIEVHAVKSAAASIGAFDLSQKAKNLEEAANKDDLRYITSYTDEFLNIYTELLYKIKDEIKLPETNGIDRESGDVSLLKEKVIILEESINLLDIDIIEQTLEICLYYNWSGDINHLLQSIKDYIESFEYYNAKPLIAKLKIEISKYY